MKRTYIETILGLILIIVAVWILLFRVQNTHCLVYLFLVFFIPVILLNTKDAIRDRTYTRMTFGNVYGLLILSFLGELPAVAMHRNSVSAYQQEITLVVQTLILILVIQAVISAVLILVYRKKAKK